MISTTSQINKFIEFIAVLGDLIILNLVLFSLLFFWEEAFVSLPFSCRVSWMMTSLSLCYLACSGSRGRVWDSRGIRPDPQKFVRYTRYDHRPALHPKPTGKAPQDL